VAALAREAVRRWRPLADGREIVLRAELPVPVPLAPAPIEQVLDVLVENAIRHGSGEISVEAIDGGDHVRVCVSDEGDVHLSEEVFERHMNRPGSDGHGIGLAVARDVAEAIGGRLVVDDGPTTSFSLLLPTR
jgi:signal transduction histidine kinase